MLPYKTVLPNGKMLVRRSDNTYDYQTKESHGTIQTIGENTHLEIFSYRGYIVSRVFRSIVSCLKYLANIGEDYRE